MALFKFRPQAENIQVALHFFVFVGLAFLIFSNNSSCLFFTLDGIYATITRDLQSIARTPLTQLGADPLQGSLRLLSTLPGVLIAQSAGDAGWRRQPCQGDDVHDLCGIDDRIGLCAWPGGPHRSGPGIVFWPSLSTPNVADVHRQLPCALSDLCAGASLSTGLIADTARACLHLGARGANGLALRVACPRGTILRRVDRVVLDFDRIVDPNPTIF